MVTNVVGGNLKAVGRVPHLDNLFKVIAQGIVPCPCGDGEVITTGKLTPRKAPHDAVIAGSAPVFNLGAKVICVCSRSRCVLKDRLTTNDYPKVCVVNHLVFLKYRF